MRASATSKSASPASVYAPQAKADANKADDASPFALLVGSGAPKDTTKDAAKPPVKNASQSDDQAQGASTAQNATNAQPPLSTPAKPVKADKTKDDAAAQASNDKPGNDAAGGNPVVADLPQLPQPTAAIPPGQQILPQQLPAAAADDDGDDLQVGATAPAAQTKPQAGASPAVPAAQLPTAFDQGAANVTPNVDSQPAPKANSHVRADNRPKTQAPAIAQPKPAATLQNSAHPSGDDSGDEESGAVATNAANPASASSISSAAAPGAAKISATQSATDQPVAAAGAEDDQSQTHPSDASKSPASAIGVQHADPHSAAAKSSLANPGHDAASDGGIIKSGVAKNQVIQADASNAGKGDIEKTDAAKSDAPKAGTPQPDIQTIAPKSAASTPAPAAIDAINTIAGSQTPSSPAAAATVSQHIQVTAHAAPDLPALAVEIAAKSQSGTKQFDIRLDPPELGRVEVRLSIDATGKASAHLSADQPQTLSLLQKDAPILTRALRDAGLDVSENGLNFSLRQQGENLNGNAANGSRRGSSRSFPLSASLSVDPAQGSAAYRAPANGRLDIKV